MSPDRTRKNRYFVLTLEAGLKVQTSGRDDLIGRGDARKAATLQHQCGAGHELSRRPAHDTEPRDLFFEIERARRIQHDGHVVAEVPVVPLNVV